LSNVEMYEIRSFKHEKLSIDMQFLVKHNGSLPKIQLTIWSHSGHRGLHLSRVLVKCLTGCEVVWWWGTGLTLAPARI